jgi:hypothetical protein
MMGYEAGTYVLAAERVGCEVRGGGPDADTRDGRGSSHLQLGAKRWRSIGAARDVAHQCVPLGLYPFIQKG